MTDQTALDALRELGEKASPRPWQSVSEEAGDVGTGLVYGAPPEEVTLGNFERDENAAYATVAVNSIVAAVEALEDVTTELSKYVGYLPIPATRVVGARRVLDAIRKAATESLGSP